MRKLKSFTKQRLERKITSPFTVCYKNLFFRTSQSNQQYASTALHGRSMVEMMGVLAIIGVLSIGAIAGYSKAMNKYRTNKLIQQYNNIFNGIITYKTDLLKTSNNNNLQSTLVKMNFIPQEMIQDNSPYLVDSLGNLSYIKKFPSFLEFAITLNSKNADLFSSSPNQLETCRTLYQYVLVPLHHDIYHTSIYIGGGSEAAFKEGTIYYGDTYCSKKDPCISDLTLSSIDRLCRACENDKDCRLLTLWK